MVTIANTANTASPRPYIRRGEKEYNATPRLAKQQCGKISLSIYTVSYSFSFTIICLFPFPLSFGEGAG
jgi:hypothetical protein